MAGELNNLFNACAGFTLFVFVAGVAAMAGYAAYLWIRGKKPQA